MKKYKKKKKNENILGVFWQEKQSEHALKKKRFPNTKKKNSWRKNSDLGQEGSHFLLGGGGPL